ncbi:MAG: class I SAM-dependent methyltransferase [Candidatus Jorgensenbacteria bacterium]
MKGINVPVDTGSKEIKVFSPEDFSSAFDEPISERLKDRIKSLNIKYVGLTPKERDECIKASIKLLLDIGEKNRSGGHRLGIWEKSWSKNLQAFKEKGKSGLLPDYFGNDDVVRWKQEWIKPLQGGFDYSVLSVILGWLFEKYAAGAGSIYEFACGTGHNLLYLREFNGTAKLYGLDWAEASQEIIREMAAKGVAQNIYGRKFDFFNPDESFVLDDNSVVFTVGGLEQIGDRCEKFIAYLLKNKPKVCFHAEPIGELLDESRLEDYLAKEYYRRKNYLANFISHLKLLEQNGKIKLQKVQRTYLGGNLFTEYMVVVWSPR